MSDNRCINGCDLTGPEIPEDVRGHYAPGSTHYSRLIGIDGGRLGIYDGVIAWTCPDCGVIWNRFEELHGAAMYKKIEDFIREAVENGDFSYPKDMGNTSPPS